MNVDFDEINKVPEIKRKKTSIELIKENFNKKERMMNDLINSKRLEKSRSGSKNLLTKNITKKQRFDYEVIDTSYERSLEINKKLNLYQAKLDKQRKKPKFSIFSNINHNKDSSNSKDPKSQKSSNNLYVFDPISNYNIKVNNHSSASSVTKNILRTITSTLDSASIDDNNYFNNDSSLKRRSGIKRTEFNEEVRDNLIYYD